MAYRIKLKSNVLNVKEQMYVSDPKMVLTREWKTVAKMTDELKHKAQYCFVETIPNKPKVKAPVIKAKRKR